MEKKIVCEYLIKQEKKTMWTNIFIVYAPTIVNGVVIRRKVFTTNTAMRLNKV